MKIIANYIYFCGKNDGRINGTFYVIIKDNIILELHAHEIKNNIVTVLNREIDIVQNIDDFKEMIKEREKSNIIIEGIKIIF